MPADGCDSEKQDRKPAKRLRKTPISESEKLLLLDLIKEKRNVIFMNDSKASTKARKNEAWDEVYGYYHNNNVDS